MFGYGYGVCCCDNQDRLLKQLKFLGLANLSGLRRIENLKSSFLKLMDLNKYKIKS